MHVLWIRVLPKRIRTVGGALVFLHCWGVCRRGGDRVPNPGPPALPCHLQRRGSHPRAAGPGRGPLPELLGVPCTGRFVAPLTSSGDPWVVESPRPQPWTKCATSVWHRVPDRTHLPGLLHSAEALTTENPTLTPAAPGQRSRGKSFKIKTLTRPFC